MNPAKRFASAISFVTCFPLVRFTGQAEDLSSLSAYLPGVGLLIGLLLCLLAGLLHVLHANPLLNAVLLTLVWLGTTGGIHFDGLMDTADGIFSHRDPQRMLEIMSDSRVGNFGVLTGLAVLFIKVASLASFNMLELIQILIVVPAWARFCEAFTIGVFPYLRSDGMGKIWHDTTVFPRDVLLSGLCPLAVTAAAAALGCRLSALSALITIIGGLSSAYWIKNILKGHTGDTYGAVVELAEVAGVLATALIVGA